MDYFLSNSVGVGGWRSLVSCLCSDIYILIPQARRVPFQHPMMLDISVSSFTEGKTDRRGSKVACPRSHVKLESYDLNSVLFESKTLAFFCNIKLYISLIFPQIFWINVKGYSMIPHMLRCFQITFMFLQNKTKQDQNSPNHVILCILCG